MTDNISATQANAVGARYPFSHLQPQPKAPAAPSEDSVHLSNQLQQILAASTKTSTPNPVTLGQIIKEAAGGDPSALARLALVA